MARLIFQLLLIILALSSNIALMIWIYLQCKSNCYRMRQNRNRNSSSSNENFYDNRNMNNDSVRIQRGLPNEIRETFIVKIFSNENSIQSSPDSNFQEVKSLTDSSCPVCLCDYHNGDSICQLPVCMHYFHSNCINAWFDQHTTCPICRVSLMADHIMSAAPFLHNRGNSSAVHNSAATSTSISSDVPSSPNFVLSIDQESSHADSETMRLGMEDAAASQNSGLRR